MGRRETLKDHKLAFRVHLMNLSRDDIQNMQSDTKYIPGPIVNDRLSFSFHMPMAMNIVYDSGFVVLPAHSQSFVQLLSDPEEREAPPYSSRPGEGLHLS
jgi:hypothetical protein